MAALAAAFLFIVHPAHVETVAWISSRKDLVAAAFALPCVLAYLKYRQRGAKSWYSISLLLFLFALLGKLSVAAFPAVLLALDLFVEKRPLSRSISDKIPFLVVAICAAVAVEHAQPSTGVQPDIGTRAQAFVQAMWLLTRAWRLCSLSHAPCEWAQLASISWSNHSGCFVPFTVAATQALPSGDCFDLLDAICLSAHAGSAVLLSCKRPIPFSAIGRSSHSHCMAIVQDNRAFAKMEPRCRNRAGRCG
jgi:hypothetical protein